jgi:hypothetical protein
MKSSHQTGISGEVIAASNTDNRGGLTRSCRIFQSLACTGNPVNIVQRACREGILLAGMEEGSAWPEHNHFESVPQLGCFLVVGISEAR